MKEKYTVEDLISPAPPPILYDWSLTSQSYGKPQRTKAVENGPFAL